jgi:hypothetical protein
MTGGFSEFSDHFLYISKKSLPEFIAGLEQNRKI